MKSNLLYLALIGLSLTACNNKPTSDKPESVIDTMNHSGSVDSSRMTFNSSQSVNAGKTMKEDSTFLTNAHEVGTFEVEAAKLAQKKSQDAKVKDFAAMMIADHTTMGKDVESLSAQKNITLPVGMGDDLKKKWDKLNDLTGKAFDKEYADVNVKGHKETIDKFEKAYKNNDNSPEVQQLAATALTKLKAHKDHADMLKDGMKM
jgi:putative membrane protein